MAESAVLPSIIIELNASIAVNRSAFGIVRVSVSRLLYCFRHEIRNAFVGAIKLGWRVISSSRG